MTTKAARLPLQRPQESPQSLEPQKPQGPQELQPQTGASSSTGAISEATPRPKVYLTGSEALVWDFQDVKHLRQTHRIVGSLAGSLPLNPMQNIFQGLPLRLLPEEAHALWSKGLVDFIDESRSYGRPLDAAVSELPADSITILEQASTTARTRAKSGSDHIVLHRRSDTLSYYSPIVVARSSSADYNSVTEKRNNQQFTADVRSVWSYPASTRDRQKSSAFMYLWATEKYFLAPGMKFGGDYLLYKNDPLICHASMIATIEDRDQPLSLLDLATRARLASTVQKQHLICSLGGNDQLMQRADSTTSMQSKRTASSGAEEQPQPSNDSVVMFELEWAGF
ncbi:hypothetical protein BC939DRAFT_504193 [Gamsiella multidivaricata]|uniref:uncharacterized protein n=1 Tax=Gamsiella multidivaricata TaxID=101098 RepID=UPI00221FB0A7|nr:uncharacterized protein BC939DRAFT_504193 [Gamsiella multidivaricata]KAI7821956.1 hypothetical protein BC939DRAFT_504193 [Gamsiella multidivaricata]